MTKKQAVTLTDEAIKAVAADAYDPASNSDELNFVFENLKRLLGDETAAKQAIDYGFYEHKNRYWMLRGRDAFAPVSNFVIRAKFLIGGANPRRIIEIRNVHGRVRTLDMEIQDMISLDRFKVRVESSGNFNFDGKASDLTRIKNLLFLEEQECIEVARLGWHKRGFTAMSNGIFTGEEFLPVDENGMTVYDGDSWYIPVIGATQAADDEDLRNYRKFKHTPSDVTTKAWATKMLEVYGDNGMMGIAFAMYAMYSDIVFDNIKGAPLMYLYGQKGSGKGSLANSLMHLFGTPQDPLMLGGASTVVGFMRKMGQFANALVWLDEYKNDIGDRKIESLKNLWDRIGYERGSRDQTMRTQSTPVTSAAIVSGQEMPNVEPALFSRMILCEFVTSTRDQRAIDAFDELRVLELKGITPVWLDILSHRKWVQTEFAKRVAEVAKMLRSAFGQENVIDRVINNYASIITITWILGERLSLPFTWQQLLAVCERNMRNQQAMMGTSDEVRTFFEQVAYLLSVGLIVDGKDIEIKPDYIRIRLVTIVPLYRDHATRQRLRVLDKGTLSNYLQRSQAYVPDESSKSHRFEKLQNPTNCLVFRQTDIASLYGVDFLANS